MPRTTHRSRTRLLHAVVAFLFAAGPVKAAVPDSIHARDMAAIDSLIQYTEFEEAIDRIETAMLAPDLSDSLRAEYLILRLEVLRHTDRWDMLLFLSEDMLRSVPLSREHVQRIRLLRAVALENMLLYEEAEAEMDRLALLFGPDPTNRNYGEFLYRSASLQRVQQRYSHARHWARRALRYNARHGHIKELAVSMLLVAIIPTATGDPDTTHDNYVPQAAGLALRAGDRLMAAALYGTVAKQLAGHDPEAARTHLQRCWDLSHKAGPQHWAAVNKLTSSVYEAFGMPDSALHFLKAHVKWQDAALTIKQSTSLRINEARRAHEQLAVAQDSEKSASRSASRLFLLSVALGAALACIATLLLLLWRQMRRIHRQHNELAQRQEQLQQLLKDKDVLLYELHHRVKNQLTIVIAIIDHELEFNEAITKEQLRIVQQRIHTIARVHEALLKRVEEHSVLNGRDLEDIARSLLTISDRPVVAEIAMEAEVGIDTSVPLMMLLNELGMNTVKHSVEQPPVIRIGLATENGELVLRYSDNGTWAGGTQGREGSSGHYIISAMARQLRGTLERAGTSYTIRFPMPEHPWINRPVQATR